MKKAPAGQIDGAGDLAHGLHRFHQRFLSDGWHSREKQAGIRVNRIVEQCVFVPHLHNGAQIHNSQPVADIFYNREVMRDCCFARKMRKVCTKNEKSMLQNCNIVL